MRRSQKQEAVSSARIDHKLLKTVVCERPQHAKEVYEEGDDRAFSGKTRFC